MKEGSTPSSYAFLSAAMDEDLGWILRYKRISSDLRDPSSGSGGQNATVENGDKKTHCLYPAMQQPTPIYLPTICFLEVRVASASGVLVAWLVGISADHADRRCSPFLARQHQQHETSVTTVSAPAKLYVLHSIRLSDNSYGRAQMA